MRIGKTTYCNSLEASAIIREKFIFNKKENTFEDIVFRIKINI